MADGNFQRAPRKKNALDNIKLRIAANNPDGKRATMAVILVSNNPRIQVYTNMPGDKDEGRFSANFSTLGFYSLLALLRRAIDFKATPEIPDYRDKVVVMRPNFKPGGGRPDGVVPAGDVWVGKDKEGRVWMCPMSYKMSSIKFIITNDEYHKFEHSTGEAFSEAEASVLAAEGYYHLLSHMTAVVQVTEWVEPPPRDPNAGGGNRGGGQGGGYNSRPAGGGGTFDRRSSGGGAPAEVMGETDGDELPF